MVLNKELSMETFGSESKGRIAIMLFLPRISVRRITANVCVIIITCNHVKLRN